MRLFVMVGELSSFAAAARRLGMSPARVTRAVAALEAAIGARLLHRTTRVVRLTEAGTTYLAQCKRILAEIEEAEEGAASSEGMLSGRLTVTAPVTFGRLYVAPVLLAFLRAHPKVSLRALFADRVMDVFEQNIDVAVRIAHLEDSGLHAIRVGRLRRLVCGSPAYLRARGVPKEPADLQRHELVSFVGVGDALAWHFARDGKHESIQPRARLAVNSVDLARLAALEGAGLINMLSYQVAADVRAGRLRVVLAEYELPPIPVHVVHREGRTGSARVRAFVELAALRLRASLAARLGKLTALRDAGPNAGA